MIPCSEPPWPVSCGWHELQDWGGVISVKVRYKFHVISSNWMSGIVGKTGIQEGWVSFFSGILLEHLRKASFWQDLCHHQSQWPHLFSSRKPCLCHHPVIFSKTVKNSERGWVQLCFQGNKWVCHSSTDAGNVES